jgi:hypothetical protein
LDLARVTLSNRCKWPLSGSGVGSGSGVVSRAGTSGNMAKPMVPFGVIDFISSLSSREMLELWKITSAMSGSSVGALSVGRSCGSIAGQAGCG